MQFAADRAIAIVGTGAILPDSPNVPKFWDNIKQGRYSITEVTPDRWDAARYFDADPTAPDKTYSKIGGWVREYAWEPAKWKLPIPPRVSNAMDGTQKWAIAATREAFEDYGYPNRPVDLERTAVILGNAMAGEYQYLTVLRAYFPEYEYELSQTPSFSALSKSLQRDITRELHDRVGKHFPEITEDTMPGELSNCIAGRIANLFNLRGPNYVVDAACASAMAAVRTAMEGLADHDFDLAVSGGIDRNMGASTFIKFCKIGALSATGSRPYAEGADGFVMGEGAAILLLKRLADAERDGDRIYAVLRAMGASSDGKGKGITAPNPIGQKLAVERAWRNAGLSPACATLIEGHGTSTRVGDVVEVQSMIDVLAEFQLPARSVALGSVKSNIGHLKAAAGAAGLLKAALSVRDKVLPPSLHCEHVTPDVDFAHSPLYVNTALNPWTVSADRTRCIGVSAFGFGGTNFHAVMEEHIPGRLAGNGKRSVTVGEIAAPAKRGEMIHSPVVSATPPFQSSSLKPPLRGALVIGGKSDEELAERLRSIQKSAREGTAPNRNAPSRADLQAPERIAIDYGDPAELADKAGKGLAALKAGQPSLWKALRAQGIFRGHGPAPKVAFMYTGQGSQYVNMLDTLRGIEPIVAETFAEADRTMTPLLGKPLTEIIFVKSSDAAAVANAEEQLRQTAITQPAVLATDMAMTRLLAAYGIEPDFTMGHSLGEYGALIASGALPFADALEAVSARGREMSRVAVKDNGKMAAVFAPLDDIERILRTINGYVVIANINSKRQAVIGGESKAVEEAIEVFTKAGFEAVALPVSHAFHTSIVAPASEPLRQTLQRLHLQSPRIPIVANVNGEFYPTGPNVVPEMLDILARQVASPVQFIKGLRTLYEAGARVFVEVGPKKALQGFADDVLGEDPQVLSLFTNHPKFPDVVAFNQALCGLYASGLGQGIAEADVASTHATQQITTSATSAKREPPAPSRNGDRFAELGHLFADVLERGWQIYRGDSGTMHSAPVAITGAALGLPGTEHIFEEGNVARILRGEQFISTIPMNLRRAMLDKHITRLVKSDTGDPTFETITAIDDVIKLAARGAAFDLETEFGVPADRIGALDRVTQLAIAAGLDALRDAGIPLVMRYKTTTKGTQLPDRWGLPDCMRDDTGVIFASAFPGYNAFANEMSRYYTERSRREQLAALEELRGRAAQAERGSALGQALERRIAELRATILKEPYIFDRRFLFRALSMGHSQFAEFVGARGPNTQINSACASTTQAVALAEDWIKTGRCRRVVVISADDVTSDQLLEWIGAGFLASGAAATDQTVEDAAIPFDRRRHGLIVGMGAAALVIESAGAARERGIRPICEVLSSVTLNSAFHGSRLDVQHISDAMETLISHAEQQSGIRRDEIAPHTVFVSHETYTPARGGSASAEIHALRRVFGKHADEIVIANTKGFTGHAMGTGIEDVVAVKALETGWVPPVANFKEIDPELGALNLSKGGEFPVEYALRLGAGFGSQVSLTLMRWVPSQDGTRADPLALGYTARIADRAAWDTWLRQVQPSGTTELEVVCRTLRVRDRVAPSETISAKPLSVRTPAEPPAKKTTAADTVAKPTAVVVSAQTPAVTIAAPVQPAVNVDTAQQRILKLVSEKTGYPIDMLDLDLDMEADLGVDTVKQAEIFASVREMYGIARDDKIKLRDFPTLAHVIRFVHERRKDQPAISELPEAVPASAASLISVPAISAAAPPLAAPEPQSAGPKARNDAVKDRIFALVVEKTGYPADMLDVDLDLEADLGIDTVKQAEMFAAIREIYNIPRDTNRKLRDYPTLAHVIQFVHENRPDIPPDIAKLELTASTPPLRSTAAGAVGATPISSSALHVDVPATDEDIRRKVLQLVVEKTGYPEDMLDLDLDLEADLGIDTVKQAELFAAIREIYDIPRDSNRRLRDYPTLAHVIRFVRENRPVAAGALAQTPATAPVASPVASHQPVTTASLQEVVAQAAAAPSEEDVRHKVLQIVAEKTGYPEDMLDLDLDLEADLGIDTVKQAEMFAAVRATFNIPREQTLKLRDFPTLAHVINFANTRRTPDAAQVANADSSGQEFRVAELAAPATTSRPALLSLDAANSIPRRVPVPVLRPPLTYCKMTAVKLGSGRRVVIVPDCGGVANVLATRLRAMDVEVLAIETAAIDSDTLVARLKAWASAGAVNGVYWLPALDSEQNLPDMNISSWREALRIRVKALYETMRALYDQFATSESFLVTATRLGGQHGYDPSGAVAPLGGAATGFTKAFKRERPDALIKAVDFEGERQSSDIAQALIDETLRDPGAVEIGYKHGLRWTVGLQEQPAADGAPSVKLGPDTVFLVTGAAGSIVSAITADLAAASGGIFYLLDVVPEPDPNNLDLQRFTADKEGLKRELFARIQARGERATPALVEKELAGLERAVAAWNAINAVRGAGGTAHYFSVNLTDAVAVANVIGQIRKRSGRIDVLLHAAGLERSHFLPDKDRNEFNLVFDVKSDGWFNLLHAIGDMPLGSTVAFSSVAGRFGNAGQTDYSSANDLLCKMTSSFRSTRPATRGIVIDWTAWGGIGMATRGSIPKMMELAGIDMLPPEAGIPLIRRELTAGGTRGEIVIGERLGVLLSEWDDSGGLDPSSLQDKSLGHPMLGRIARAGVYDGIRVETTLDPKLQPFLRDHQIDGTPVLPGVMGVEAFAEAALVFAPGWRIEAIEKVNFQSPFKFYRNEPRTVIVEAFIHAEHDSAIADCRLMSRRTLPNQKEPQTTTHFTGRVRLTQKPFAAVPSMMMRTPDTPAVSADEIYRVYFHGPAYQVLDRAWFDGKQLIGRMSRQLPADRHPAELTTATAPRMIELCLQTAGLWEISQAGRMGLPRHIGEISILRPLDAADVELYAVVSSGQQAGTFNASVADVKGNLYLNLRGYQTVELTNLVDSDRINRLRDAMAAQHAVA